MGFLGALGWVLFSFVLGALFGIFVGVSARRNIEQTKKPESDQKVAEK